MNLRHLLAALAVGSLTGTFAQSGYGSSSALPEWKDPAIVSRGRAEARTEFVTFPDRPTALHADFADSPGYRSLNGDWDFRFYEAYADVEDNVLTDRSLSWNTIRVPGNWELQGYGVAIYTNQPYEFQPRNPRPPMLPEQNPVGIYRRRFTLDQSWIGRDIYLNICGAKSGVYLYINGREVGYSEDSKDLAQFRIDDFVRVGENEVVLKIYRWSTGSYLECQDFWRISGIERDVYLSSMPKHGIYDFTIVSTLDDSYCTGLFSLDVQVQGAPDKIDFRLLDADGATVLSGEQRPAGPTVHFEASLPEVKPWSDETPYCYTLLLGSTADERSEYIPFSVGFRRFEFAQTAAKDVHGRPYNVLLVNGKPVKFRGVNVHEHNPATGHYVTDAELLRDIELMRLNNINAIRTCHYPQSRRFYELCDRYGIYVYCEANIESHGMGYDLARGRSLANNRAWLPAHMDRIANMYGRCKNYPSVAIWSLGNEAGNGYNFYRAYEYIEQFEKGPGRMNRPICYERALWEWNSDMYVPQYPSADWLEKIGREGSDRPVVPSEYAHAMGNSSGGIAKQWQAINRYPNLQGGFIWDWIDQGFDARDSVGRAYWTYGGDYGENAPSDANFLCNGIVGPDRMPHPAMEEVKYAYQPVGVEAADAQNGRFRLVNRFCFTPLDRYVVGYTVEENGEVIASGERRFTTAPLLSEEFMVALPRSRALADRYITFRVRTTAAERMIPAGHELSREQFLIARGAGRAAFVPQAFRRAAAWAQRDSVWSVAFGAAGLSVDARTGCVRSYKAGGKELLADGFGIRPNFWRAPTDNDYGNGFPARSQVWKAVTRAIADPVDTMSRVVSIETSAAARQACLTVHYATPVTKAFVVTYTLYADGALNISSSIEPTALAGDEIPRVGFRMRLPLSAEAFTYLGRGPAENYADRKVGSLIGRYRTSATAEYYPYVRPQECGHHCDAAWIDFGRLTVVAADRFEFNALRQTIENLDSEENTHRNYQWRNFSSDESHDPAAAKNRLRRQHHINDVRTEPFVEVCIDHAQTGVGGYNSWGARPDPECLLTPGRIAWDFTLVPATAAPAREAVTRDYTK